MTGQSQTSAGPTVEPSIPRQYSRAAPAEPTGWVGWIVFAATVMVLIGTFHIIEGLVGILNKGFYLVSASGLTVNVNYNAWGWTLLATGALMVAAGVGLFAGQMWARVIGVVLAGLSALVNFAFIPAYPFWSLAVIAIDIFVIYALTAHGREMKAV